MTDTPIYKSSDIDKLSAKIAYDIVENFRNESSGKGWFYLTKEDDIKKIVKGHLKQISG